MEPPAPCPWGAAAIPRPQRDQHGGFTPAASAGVWGWPWGGSKGAGAALGWMSLSPSVLPQAREPALWPCPCLVSSPRLRLPSARVARAHTHTEGSLQGGNAPNLPALVALPWGLAGSRGAAQDRLPPSPSLVHITAFHRNFTEGETEARSWVSPGSRQNLPRPLPLSSALSPGTGISIPRPCALRGSQPCSFLTPPPAGRAPRGAPFGAVREQWGCAALPGGCCPRVVLYPGAGELRERRVGVLAAVLAAQLLQGLEAGRPAAQALLVRTKQK